MTETAEKPDARTQIQTVKIVAYALVSLQTRDELRICGGCDTFWAPADLENGRCPPCRPEQGQQQIVDILHSTFRDRPGDYWLAARRLIDHCAPKVPSAVELASLIKAWSHEPPAICAAFARQIVEKWATLNDQEVPAPKVPSQKALTELIRAFNWPAPCSPAYAARRIIEDWAKLNEVALPQEDPAPMDEGGLVAAIQAWTATVQPTIMGTTPQDQAQRIASVAHYIVQQQRDHLAPKAKPAAMHNAAIEEDFNQPRHVHDTMDEEWLAKRATEWLHIHLMGSNTPGSRETRGASLARYIVEYARTEPDMAGLHEEKPREDVPSLSEAEEHVHDFNTLGPASRGWCACGQREARP